MSPALMFLALTAAQATEWTPSETDIAVHKALSARHDDTACTEIAAMSEDSLTTFTNIVAHATQPPWAAMRAARCITELHAEAAQDEITRWVTDPGLAGLRLQTLNRIDKLPEAVAAHVANAALAAGHEDVDPDQLIATDPRLAGVLTVPQPETP